MSKTFSTRRAHFKFAFAALLALTFCMAHPTSTAYAKKRRPAKYGSINILSTPGGLVIALAPESGRMRWRFDARVDSTTHFGDYVSRGVSTWLA